MQDEAARPVAYWRVILAAILDVVTAFAVFGYVVAKATGNTTESGFKLEGAPAFVLFALIVAYFFVGNRLGGTLWRRILRVPPRPRA